MRWDSDMFDLMENYPLEKDPMEVLRERARDSLKSVLIYMVETVRILPESVEKFGGLAPWAEGFLSFDIHVKLDCSGLSLLWELEIEEPIDLMQVIPRFLLPLSDEAKGAIGDTGS